MAKIKKKMSQNGDPLHRHTAEFDEVTGVGVTSANGDPLHRHNINNFKSSTKHAHNHQILDFIPPNSEQTIIKLGKEVYRVSYGRTN